MPRRVSSPAWSENEVDIAGSLFAESADSAFSLETKPDGLDLDLNDILNVGGDGGDGGEEEDFISSTLRSANRKSSNLKGKSVKKGGGFQAMGLSAHLLRAITKKGFSVPTPIQRKTIPLVMDRKDVVGMARTGSGKTAAFVIPMIERLKAHSAKVGARALILSPSRELALQTLKVVKEFGRGTNIRTALLVGGESLEEHFGVLSSNPDVIIGTPGRFLHLKVEMGLDLSSIKYVVFDEADRLFEMGFAEQLTEILHALPPSRQTLLFSATLPSSLVEFARAGLQDPSLVRLDAETKISPDLESAFFAVKGAEKDGALLHVLQDVLKVPLGVPEGVEPEGEPDKSSRKRKRGSDRTNAKEKPTEHSTIIFAATKHHVEYLATLLQRAGFVVSHVYGSLDQTARKNQVEDFRRGRTHIMVVTDVAARGIDIPILANVINYDFPPQPKIFVHRVGRTARAGQRGLALSLVRDTDTPYLLDLQLFLGRRLLVGQEGIGASLTKDVVVGVLQRSEVEPHVEWVQKALDDSEDLGALQRVAGKAEKLYIKTRHSASAQSAKRAREIVASRGWTQLHALFGEDAAKAEQMRSNMLAKIGAFKPQETIFEIGPRGKSDKNHSATVVRNFRSKVGPRRTKSKEGSIEDEDDGMGEVGNPSQRSNAFPTSGLGGEAEGEEETQADSADDDLEVTVSSTAIPTKGQNSFQDAEVFMSYTPRALNTAEEKGYGVHSGSQTAGFVESARNVTMDLNNDETARGFAVPTRSRMRWDKKQSKYVSRDNDTDGSRGAKMIRGESGVKIAASFQSGRFDRWRKAQRLGKMPRVGELEKSGGAGPGAQGVGGPRYKHKAETAPKEADKFRDDYHVRKKRVAEAKEKRVGKYKDGEGSRREIKSALDIRKARQLKEQRRTKNARPRGAGKGGRA